MIRSTIVPMYYKDYFVNFAPEPNNSGFTLILTFERSHSPR